MVAKMQAVIEVAPRVSRGQESQVENHRVHAAAPLEVSHPSSRLDSVCKGQVERRR